jgi:hypothetical protein
MRRRQQMTVKKMLLTLLILGFTMSLFAYGQRDEWGKRKEEFKNFLESKERIILTGKVFISNRVFPELKVGNDVYKLMVPRYCLADPDITDNKEVTVEGVLLKVKQGVHTRFLNEGDEVFFVTKAMIDGEEYIPEQGYEQCQGSCRGRMGHHHQGHYGPGFHGSPLDLFE